MIHVSTLYDENIEQPKLTEQKTHRNNYNYLFFSEQKPTGTTIITCF